MCVPVCACESVSVFVYSCKCLGVMEREIVCVCVCAAGCCPLPDFRSFSSLSVQPCCTSSCSALATRARKRRRRLPQMVPAPKKGVRAKGAAEEVNKGPPIRKSVDGDGCWDVASNERLDCFEFVGAQGSPARPSEGGSETVVICSKYSGKWRTIMGEQCYMTGVHYLAMRVEGHSSHRHRELVARWRVLAQLSARWRTLGSGAHRDEWCAGRFRAGGRQRGRVAEGLGAGPLELH